MTINQAHNYIKLELDKTSSLELPAFEQEEIDYWFDDATLRFVKNRYTASNMKKESFEQSEKRIDDLRSLVVESSPITTSGDGTHYPNSEVFSLSGLIDYLFSLRENVEITASTVTTAVSITPVTHDNVNFKLDDPFAQHNYRLGTAKPLRLFTEDDNITVIGDGNYTIDNLRLSYLKTPMKANLSPTGVIGTADRDLDYPDLSDSVMHEIVKQAANSMIENIESQRYQTHSIEVAKSE